MVFKQKRDSARMLAAVSVAAVALSSTSAFAQEPADAGAKRDTVGLEEIIVQARKVNENLQDVPVAITAFTGEQLEAQNVQRVQDLANFTPGLAMREGQSSRSALTLTLRGQVQTDILATLDPSVGTYVDGVYWSRAYGLNADLLDVQSVQVLKGPQGTLFGRNTTGGAMLINSNNPDMNEFGGRASLTYGRFDEMTATGVINIPIVNDRIALRVAGQRARRDGYTLNASVPGTALTGNTVIRRNSSGSPAGSRLDNRDRWNFRGKLQVNPTDNLSLLFSAEYFDMEERAPGRQLRLLLPSYSASNSTYSTSGTGALFIGLTNGATPATAVTVGQALAAPQIAGFAADPGTTQNNETPYSAARTYTYGFTAALDTDFGEIKFISGIRRVSSFAGIDLEGSSYAIHFTEAQQKLKQQSAELQITGKAFGDAVDFAAGAFVFHESGSDQSISVTVPALNGATSHFAGLIDNDSIGLYGQATWHFTDALSFTGGLRYSVDDKLLETRNNNYIRGTGMTICSVIPVAPFNAGGEVVGPAQCGVRRGDDFHGISYTAGLDYRINDDALVYIKTSKGFRSGGQNLRAPNTAAFIPFLPETAYAYEIGLKSEFFDRRVRLNIAAYQTDVKNIQRTTLIATPPIPPSTVPGSATILGNAGKSRFRGVEVELQALLFDGFTVSASGALIDPKYIRFSDLSGDRSFERFVGVAEEQFAVSADYSTAIGSSNRVKLHVDYSWRGDIATAEYNFVANPNNDAIIAATTAKALGMLGARASVEFGDNLELAVFGRNITNRRNYVQNLLVAPLGYITGIRNEPATYGMTASFKF